MTTDLKELLERVEGLSGPDREVDAALCIALRYIRCADDPQNLRLSEVGSAWLDYELLEDGKYVECSDSAPELTSSNDAITRLIEQKLPGWHISSGTVGEDGWPWACLTEPDGECRDFDAHHVSEALARSAALLRALMSTKEPK